MRSPTIVGVGGFTSEVGKTTLMCELLRAFPGWEAIKTTRGHYRSCGKDPRACCVSHLLKDDPVIRSGRELTYSVGKDTGRYWDAGAANVHWLIATDVQVGAGINKALKRVEADGVFVEGNSFTKFIEPNYFVMVVRPDDLRIKPTARKALHGVSAFYVSSNSRIGDKQFITDFLAETRAGSTSRKPQVFLHSEVPELIVAIRELAYSVQATDARPPHNRLGTLCDSEKPHGEQ